MMAKAKEGGEEMVLQVFLFILSGAGVIAAVRTFVQRGRIIGLWG
jgi:hypothetical protein